MSARTMFDLDALNDHALMAIHRTLHQLRPEAATAAESDLFDAVAELLYDRAALCYCPEHLKTLIHPDGCEDCPPWLAQADVIPIRGRRHRRTANE